MIVTCERCATQFQLDDSRVPEGGVRVRCSRCKHSFPIEHPSKAKAAAGLVEKRIADAAKGPQGPPPGLRLGGKPEEPTTPAGGDDEESDWQFNEDLPFDGEASIDGRLGTSAAGRLAAAADSVGAPDAMSPSGLDLADDPPKRPKPIKPAPIKPSTVRPPALQPAQAPQIDEAPLQETSLDELDIGDGSDELESPEDWDLFGGDHDRRAASGTPSATATEASGAGLGSAEYDVGSVDLEEDVPRWRSGLAQVGDGVGWLLAIGLFGFGLYGAFGPRANAATSTPSSVVMGGLEVSAAQGRWIENAIAGPVYVVSGGLRNTGSRDVLAPVLAVEVLDARGRALDMPPIPLQSRRSEYELRELSPKALSEVRPLGDGLGRIPPGPGVFDAVLGRLPVGAADFRIVASEAMAPDPPASVTGRIGGRRPSAPEPSPEAASPAPDPASGVAAQTDDEIVPPAAPARDVH